MALILSLALDVQPAAQSLSYPIVYVAAPRAGDNAPSPFADVMQPYALTANSDLRIRYPDGRDELLVDAGSREAIADPSVTLDGKSVLYARCADVTPRRDVPGLAEGGCDIERVDVARRTTTRLTHQEREPNTSSSLPPQAGGTNPPVYNGGPWELSDGRIIFTSNRRNFYPTKNFGAAVSQLYVMNADGSDAHNIMPMSLAGVLHPIQLTDGRIAFSTQESQGFRDSRLWGLWASYPDGRNWAPLVSAFAEDTAFHFATELPNRHLVYEPYYNLHNAGFGTFWAQPLNTPAPQFFSASRQDNPPITVTLACGKQYGYVSAFTWKGTYAVTPWSHHGDEASAMRTPSTCENGFGPANAVRLGKVTHPSAAPGGGLLMVYSAGPVNPGQRRPSPTPYPQAGIYLAPAVVTSSPDQLVKIVDDPNVNELWPRALVPYSAIYGIAKPAVVPFEPNDGIAHAALPAGTAYGLIGTSTVFSRESFPGNVASMTANYQPHETYDGLNTFAKKFTSTNFWLQGADVRLFQDNEIAAVRIVMMEARGTLNPSGWTNAIAERVRIVGDAPIQADGSFLARVPADTPITFQLLDRNGQALTHAQTWHQVRPGEVKADCGGCHAHSKAPAPFQASIAARTPPTDLTLAVAHDAEYRRDIEPIVQKACISCHKGALDGAPARLAFTSDPAANYQTLANDLSGKVGLPIPGGRSSYEPPQLSRYVRALNAARSLLTWVLAGKRLDGWTNDRFPGPAPGPYASIPAAWASVMADVDWSPGSVDHSKMVTDAQRRLISAWIDLGAPFDSGHFFDDENRPAIGLQVSKSQVTVGASDAYSGIDAASVSVTIDGKSASLVPLPDARWTAALPAGARVLTVRVKDRAGNWAARTLPLDGAVLPPGAGSSTSAPRAPRNVKIASAP